MNETRMTVEKLAQLLQKYPPGMEVLMSTDEDMNQVKPIIGAISEDHKTVRPVMWPEPEPRNERVLILLPNQ